MLFMLLKGVIVIFLALQFQTALCSCTILLVLQFHVYPS